MTPVSFDGCLGWLHSGAISSDVAVLLCPPLGRDGLDSYHSFRVLADALAATGTPALRFSYPGTMDSREVSPGADPWEEWLGAVRAGMDWLRGGTGATRIVLCGLRIGGTLAAVAAEGRDEVAGLILLAPVLRGRSYMRQISIEMRMLTGKLDPAGGLDLGELRLEADTVARICAVDLRASRLPGTCALAVFSQAGSPALDECVAAWTADGHAVFTTGFAPLAPLLRRDLDARGSEPAEFSDVLHWLRRVIVPVGSPARAITPVSCVPHADRREWPLRFGPDDTLFGVLCEPPGEATGRPLVIIGNAGRDPHYGIHRYGVQLARDLAARGFASLRIDFAGLGDSLSPPGTESHVFETSRVNDFAAALDALQRRGYARFAAHGVCAGAYHALQIGLADRRIGALLLVNLPFFEWEVGDTIESSARKTYSPRHYAMRLLRRDIWLRLLGNEIDVRAIARAQLARMRGRIAALARRVARTSGLNSGGSFAHRSIDTLVRRGVRTLVLMAEADEGIDAIVKEFGPGGIGLNKFPDTRCVILPELDHTLSTRHMRQWATYKMVAFLEGGAVVENG